MANKTTPPTNIAARNKATREAIYEADPVAFAIEAMRGLSAPVRDLAGRVVGETAPLPYEKRVDIALALSRKILPDLAASQIDLKASTDGQIQIVFGGITPPGSGPIIDHEPTSIERGEAVESPALEERVEADVPLFATSPDPDPTPEPAPIRVRRRTRPE